jgi:predicted O-methyltransferase YrrM
MQGVPERHEYFLAVVKAIIPSGEARTFDVLEIGSWAGASTVSWALALQEVGAVGLVTCVDPWQPYFEAPDADKHHYLEMNQAAGDGLITLLFNHNIRAAGVADMVRQHRDYSRNALPSFPAGHFDIVYIDGSHRFEDVCFDILEAKRLLRDGGVICGDDLEILPGDLPRDELAQAISGGQDYVYCASTRSHYHPGVTGAVGREFQAVGVWGGFWAVRRQGGTWTVPALDLSALRMPDHILNRQRQARLIDSSETYNFVESGGTYFAVQKKLGPVELFQEQLGDRELPPLLLTGVTLDEVWRKAELQKPSIPEGKPEGPVFIGVYGEFNLVAHHGLTYALRNSLGPVSLADGEDALRRRFGPEDFTVAAGAATARGMIDQIELIRKGAGATAELVDSITDLAAEMRTLRADNDRRAHEIADLVAEMQTLRENAAADNDRRAHEIADLAAEMQALREHAAADKDRRAHEIADLAAQMRTLREKAAADNDRRAHDISELQAGLTVLLSECAELRELLETNRQAILADLRTGLHTSRRALLAEWKAVSDHFERGFCTRLETAVSEISARMETFSGKQDLMSRQVALMRYGPGSPETPCLVGESFGFRFAHYRGLVYALRRPLDLDDLSRGVRELLAVHGPNDVIVGDTLDGVRARVETGEGLREVRADIAAVNLELLAADRDLADRLRQVDSIVQAHANDLEKLRRQWWNRVFN